MTILRVGFLALGAVCVLTLGACSGKGDKLSDAELAKMLHTDGQADSRIDANAVDCLRTWSGDDSLATGLPPGFSGDGRDNCRRLMQSWLDNPDRNPQKLMFVDVSTPSVTKRAMALLAALPPAPAIVAAAPPPPPVSGAPMVPVDSASTADINPSNASVKFNEAASEVDALCAQASDIAKASGVKEPGLLHRIENCATMASKTRASLSNVAEAGNPFAVAMISRNADTAVKKARKLVEDVRSASGK